MQEMNKPDIVNCVGLFLGPKLGFSDDILQNATEYIVDHSQGVFLWVRLVKEELLRYSETGCFKAQIFGFLESLPTELEGLYNRMLKQLDSGTERDIAHGIKMFRFILFGRQSPTVAELQHALAVPDGPFADVTENSFQDRMIMGIEKRVIHCGRNFLEIQGRDGMYISKYLEIQMSIPRARLTLSVKARVQVMHQTAREFLLRPNDSMVTSRFTKNAKDAHI